MKDLYALFRFSLAGLRVMVVATLVLGVAYPLLVTGVAQVALPWRADGSLVTATGAHTTDPDEAVGSSLLGQLVDDPGLFQPRPSAAGDGYDTLATYGSNYGPESPDLVAAVKERQAEIAEREGVSTGEVPPDAVTASGSGLDPHVSEAYAALQVPRVAAANGLTEDVVRRLVDEHTDGRTLGVLGEPRVDVLALNIAVTQAARD
ncbi:potassium-transporting ATPase subunit KdpC [Nocardioides sp.]|uniref:potassium-transporting ATPase subunit KdpC n=1 Tax=Nocardioides sp. TaxID=35761 RepID=UPI002715751B|nr:potassium-transporting ATPase subunit KdpC [Nocardioides sp.]MDO9457344.1 potassium-transporting ATPase subunit KdpC [Nocardioides sp.]